MLQKYKYLTCHNNLLQTFLLHQIQNLIHIKKERIVFLLIMYVYKYIILITKYFYYSHDFPNNTQEKS